MGGGARRRPWVWALLGLAVAVHLLFLVSLRTRTLNPLFNDAYNRPGPSADFFSVYHAGRQIVTGRDPYLNDERPRVTPEFAPFRYPPAVALTVGVAVSQLRPWVAYGIWLVAIEAVLVASLLLLRRLVERRRHRDLLTAGWLAFTPLYLELWMGQWTLVTGCLVLFACAAWQESRDRLGAGLWSAACVVKLFPLALVPALLRRRRFSAVAVCASALGLSLLWFAWHPRDWEIFVRLNVTEVDLRSFHAGNFGLQALLYDLVSIGGAPSPEQWRWIAAALSLALIAVTTAAMTWRRSADFRVSAAMALLLLPLLSKHVWEHHYVLALPALTLLVAAWADHPRRLAGLAVAYALLWLPSPLALLQRGGPTWYPEQAWSPATRAGYRALEPLTLLALYGYCVWIQLRAAGHRHSDSTSMT